MIAHLDRTSDCLTPLFWSTCPQEYLIADDDLTTNDLLIGLPVLQHLQIDTKTLLESNRSVLDGTDCALAHTGSNTANGGYVSGLMIMRLNRISDSGFKDDGRRTSVDYFSACAEKDPLPDASLLDPLDIDQHEENRCAVDKLADNATANGLSPKHRSALRDMLHNHMDVFRTSFSSGPPAKLRPLSIELESDARPVRVRLRNYSKDQREFLSKFVSDLLRHGMAYPNPTSPWACAPHLFPKPGALFLFTVDLRPINKYTVRHQFSMPNLEQELTKLSDSRYFGTFDLSHGYWQLPLERKSQELQSFITPDGIYSPTRVLHGTTNAVSQPRMDFKEWPDILPVVQCALNNAPSPQRGNVAPMTAFIGRQPSPPIKTFLRTTTIEVVPISDVQQERALNISKLRQVVSDLHPIVQSDLQSNQQRSRERTSRGSCPTLQEVKTF